MKGYVYIEDNGFGEKWAILKDDYVEIWSQTFSFHPWKNRVYEPTKDVVSYEEFKNWCLEKWYDAKENSKNIEVENELKNKKVYELETWLETLPESVDEFTINKRTREVSDSLGNFLFCLPTTPCDFESWLNETLDEYYNFCE